MPLVLSGDSILCSYDIIDTDDIDCFGVYGNDKNINKKLSDFLAKSLKYKYLCCKIDQLYQINKEISNSNFLYLIRNLAYSFIIYKTIMKVEFIDMVFGPKYLFYKKGIKFLAVEYGILKKIKIKF
jgi:hypothetical protein